LDKTEVFTIQRGIKRGVEGERVVDLFFWRKGGEAIILLCRFTSKEKDRGVAEFGS